MHETLGFTYVAQCWGSEFSEVGIRLSPPGEVITCCKKTCQTWIWSQITTWIIWILRKTDIVVSKVCKKFTYNKWPVAVATQLLMAIITTCFVVEQSHTLSLLCIHGIPSSLESIKLGGILIHF